MIEVKQTESGRWGLYVNEILIGDSKSRFDADHAKVMLEKALPKSHVPMAGLEKMAEIATRAPGSWVQHGPLGSWVQHGLPKGHPEKR